MNFDVHAEEILLHVRKTRHDLSLQEKHMYITILYFLAFNSKIKGLKLFNINASNKTVYNKRTNGNRGQPHLRASLCKHLTLFHTNMSTSRRAI